jgi:hypothetical protein
MCFTQNSETTIMTRLSGSNKEQRVEEQVWFSTASLLPPVEVHMCITVSGSATHGHHWAGLALDPAKWLTQNLQSG